MTTKTTSARGPGGRLLDWLGLRHSRSGAPRSASDAPDPGGARDLSRQARSDLVAAIANYLIEHDLDVSPANLLIAHPAFSGSYPQLARRIALRAPSADGVDPPCTDQIGGEDQGRSSNTELGRLRPRLARRSTRLNPSP